MKEAIIDLINENRTEVLIAVFILNLVIFLSLFKVVDDINKNNAEILKRDSSALTYGLVWSATENRYLKPETK